MIVLGSYGIVTRYLGKCSLNLIFNEIKVNIDDTIFFMRNAIIIPASSSFLVIPLEIAQKPALSTPGKRTENVKTLRSNPY